MTPERTSPPPAPRSGPSGPDDGRDIVVSRSWLWPALIVCGLTVVVLVNIGFVWVAVSGADEVVPTYLVEER